MGTSGLMERQTYVLYIRKNPETYKYEDMYEKNRILKIIMENMLLVDRGNIHSYLANSGLKTGRYLITITSCY